MVPLDILSDPICPWCYIGKARFDAAVRQTGRNPFKLSWRMYRLNPEMPREGMDRRAYLEGKFGGPRRAAEVYGQIAEAARASGLDLDLDGIERTPQTLDAHRLIHWALAEDRQTEVVDALFRRYFEAGEDISDAGVLADAAAEAGLDRSVIARLLEGDADTAAIEEAEAQARKMGVRGVPCFVINARYVLQGAQETSTWVRVIEELDAALEADARDASAAAAGTGGSRP